MRKDIIIYTDGACKSNPGPGGYAAIVLYGNEENLTDDNIVQTIVSGSSNTTNNIMEMNAILKSLEYCINVITNNKNDSKYSEEKKLNLKLYSDSEYCIKGITIWSEGWIKKNFKGVKNSELWKELLDVVNKIQSIKGVELTFNKVKGHSGDYFNEMVDTLASDEAIKYQENKNNDIDFEI